MVSTHANTDVKHTSFLHLKDEMEAHSIAEKRFFYDVIAIQKSVEPLIIALDNEHRRITTAISRLSQMSADETMWLIQAKELCETVEKHFAYEEKVVFNKAGELLTQGQLHDLADDYLEEAEYQLMNVSSTL